MASDPLSTQGDKIRCDACPVMCYIKPGALGACDRYGNRDGDLYRVDPHVVLERRLEDGGTVVPFGLGTLDWGGDILREPQTFVTAIGRPARPIRITSPRPSSSRPRSRGSTWSRS